MMTDTERLVLVGWPGAEWGRVQALLRAGLLPHLARLARAGASGPLITPPPYCHAASWTTVATGVLADRHGVLSPHEVRPDGGGVQDAGQRSWHQPALWQVLTEAGKRTVCVGWPATAPATRWQGCHVDERVARATGSSFETWALPADAVAPAEWRECVRGLRVHPADGLQGPVTALLPSIVGIDPRLDQTALLLGAALAEASTMHAISTHFAAGAWDFLCTCYHVVRLVEEGISASNSVRPPGIRDYELQDMMLGRLIQLAGNGVTIIVVSAGAVGPSGSGFLVASGHGIAAGQQCTAALTDLAPTIFQRFGIATETDGQVIPGLTRPGRSLVPSACRPTLPSFVPGDTDLSLSLAQAACLRDHAVITRLNLADVHMARGDPNAAAIVLEQLLLIDPAHCGALQRLIECRGRQNDGAACLAMAETLLALDVENPWGHLGMAAGCVLCRDGTDATMHIGRALALGGADAAVRLRAGGLMLLQRDYGAAETLFRLACTETPHLPEAWYGLGVTLAAIGEVSGALSALRHSIKLQPMQPMAHLQLAAVFGAQADWRASLAAVQTALSQRPGLSGAGAILAAARTGLAAEIAEAARRSAPA